MARDQKLIFDGSKKRGMAEALSYVSKGWFPVNGEVLKLVRDRLNQGVYTSEPNRLVQDLKGDLALFTYALKRLHNVSDKSLASKPPTEVLQLASVNDLNKIFQVPDDEISPHRFDLSMKAQVLCLRQSMISATTSEALAEKNRLNPDLAFTCSSVRNLGLNLIAWNYPRIFTKALQSVPVTNEALDQVLLKTLGYSPLQLGLKASLDWSSSNEIRYALGDDVEELDPNGELSRLRSICELGESFARINDPEHFPGAVRNFERVMASVQEHLGSDGLALIRKKMERYGAGDPERAAVLLRIDPTPEKQVRAAGSQLAERMLERNNYVRKCPEEVQALFRLAYEALAGAGASGTAVNLLVSQIVPPLGKT